MKYLCLIYDGESKRGTMPKQQLDAMIGGVRRFYRGHQEEPPVHRR